MQDQDHVDADMESTPHTDEDIRRAALSYISEAWADAMADGVDPDAVSHAAMFTAFVDLVSTYGEEAVAELAEGLPERVRRGDYTIERTMQ